MEKQTRFVSMHLFILISSAVTFKGGRGGIAFFHGLANAHPQPPIARPCQNHQKLSALQCNILQKFFNAWIHRRASPGPCGQIVQPPCLENKSFLQHASIAVDYPIANTANQTMKFTFT